MLSHELRFALPACGGEASTAPLAGGPATAGGGDGSRCSVCVYSELRPDGRAGVLTAASVRVHALAWRERIILSRGPLPAALIDAFLDAGASAVVCPRASSHASAHDAHDAGVPAHEVALDDAEFARRTLALVSLLRCGHGAVAASASARLADVCAVHLGADVEAVHTSLR